MSEIPTYSSIPVPPELSGYVSRILRLQHDAASEISIPARPTGHVYLGWLARGRATAYANDSAFSIEAGEGHVSGQLSVFDAHYTIHGPALQFLAEFTPTGACRLLKQDLGGRQNCCDVFEFPRINGGEDTAFLSYLVELASAAAPPDLIMTAAVKRIDESRGDLSISALARDLGLSERHFRREFLKSVGIAPKPYAMIKKVLSSLQSLVENPESELSDVALESGFYDQAHLNKVFRLYLRTTPGNLRLDEDGVLKSIVAGA